MVKAFSSVKYLVCETLCHRTPVKIERVIVYTVPSTVLGNRVNAYKFSLILCKQRGKQKRETTFSN